MNQHLKIILLFTFVFFLIYSCKKENADECIDWGVIPDAPYNDPIWHPSGEIIGFNHIPIKEIHYNNGYDYPQQATYLFDDELSGFWIINEDGTNQRRILPNYLQTPVWSPDGNWIAFVKGEQIYKMPFDGEKFDTANIVQLTFEGRNYFPSWSSDGEWIAYDSNVYSENGGYRIWKMRNTSNDKKLIANGRMPTWKSQNEIIYIGLGYDIYSISLLDSSITKLTNDGINKHYPKYSNISEKVAFISHSSNERLGGLFTIDLLNNAREELIVSDVLSFSWAFDGKHIVYLNFNGDYIDESKGALWIINIENNNKRQLTYNYFNITN